MLLLETLESGKRRLDRALITHNVKLTDDENTFNISQPTILSETELNQNLNSITAMTQPLQNKNISTLKPGW